MVPHLMTHFLCQLLERNGGWVAWNPLGRIFCVLGSGFLSVARSVSRSELGAGRVSAGGEVLAMSPAWPCAAHGSPSSTASPTPWGTWVPPVRPRPRAPLQTLPWPASQRLPADATSSQRLAHCGATAQTPRPRSSCEAGWCLRERWGSGLRFHFR